MGGKFVGLIKRRYQDIGRISQIVAEQILLKGVWARRKRLA